MTDRLAVLVHELRNPVAALVAIAEVAVDQRPLEPELARHLVGLALLAGRDVERLALDAIPASLSLEPVDLGQLVLEAAATARVRGQNVRADIGAGLPALEGDPVRLRQALANLLENAHAHSPGGEEVLVSAHVLGDRVEVSVTDRGEGIDAAQQAQIFEPGARLADRPGEGIGLTIAKAIAEAHGGTLTVSSAPGAGATFTLALPPGGGARG
jgi:two-component system, OmpR family, sensor histidine kinase BaeS